MTTQIEGGPNNPSQLTESEHQALVIDYNDCGADYPADKTIMDLFIAQAARTPEDEAIRFGAQSLTYRALNERSNQIAACLGKLGIGPEQMVTVCMDHSVEVVCAILGVLKAGAAYVPVESNIPRERLAFMLRGIRHGCDGRLPILLTQARLVDDLPEDIAQIITVDSEYSSMATYSPADPTIHVSPHNLAYVIFTSGSTGTPKGVMIEHRSLTNYIWWANQQYCRGERLTWPLFSSLAFDLTVTSLFTPLISGGRIVVYREDPKARGTAIFQVLNDHAAEIIKLTPSHLAMIMGRGLRSSSIRRVIVGGEDFKTDLARKITEAAGNSVEIFNEYGPTEATVGCMIHRYEPKTDLAPSVPIGVPAANGGVYILDSNFKPVPSGVVGEMFVAGVGLARGYFNREDLTAELFLSIEDPRQKRRISSDFHSNYPPLRVYKTGDLARWGKDGRMEFLGRIDQQVKIGGRRIELGEIEARLLKHPDIRECHADVTNRVTDVSKIPTPISYCSRCGLASNVPGTSFDEKSTCNLCRSFDAYKEKAQAYFKTPDELKSIVAQVKASRSGEHDCLVMLSGGKDSTYMLYQLCGLGLQPLAFTLDNGFISEEAKQNIRRTVQALGVDHVFGTTPHMNEIFVDSLNRFANVCNGCFKTIYTLATHLAREKRIRYIFTGLSRGQFFETRLTEEVFQRNDFDVGRLDALVLDARKSYHRRQDAVAHYLEVDIFRDDEVFDQIEFVDFYRYWSVPLEQMYAFLDEHASWVRPSDTGRSTNCLINDLGIYIHKQQRGYHNYALPYSWDVRLGQKRRDEAMAELDDEINEDRVRQIMRRIGYVEPALSNEPDNNQLVAYYVTDKNLETVDLRSHLATELPDYMVPRFFVRLDKLPITSHGKTDRQALPIPRAEHLEVEDQFIRPQTETEKALALIWTELLKVEKIGVNDEFFKLGGHSLLAIKAVARVRDVFGVELPLEVIFGNPTIARLAAALAHAEGSSGNIPRGEASEHAEPCPVSFAQEQLWFLNQLVPGSPAYNMVDVLPIHGEYAAAAMARAVNDLLARHGILRTSFLQISGQAMQVVTPTLEIELPEIDLTPLAMLEKEREWKWLVDEQGGKPFDFAQAPLFRATMVHFSEREHRLLLTTHHIVADEWSMEIIHRDLSQLYNSYLRNDASRLPELPIQYVDFALWQRKVLQNEKLEKQLEYWRTQLIGAPTVLDLPTDKPRPVALSGRGAMEFFQIPSTLLYDLKALGREEHVTLFMLLNAVFAALLHRYTGQEDILIGTPISGRTRSETENLVGLFLNTVVLRSQFTDRLQFRGLLQQMRERALGAYAHPDLPFHHLVAEIAPDRELARSPLFQVMFILHNPDGISQVSRAAGNRDLATGTAKFELNLILSETEQGIDGVMEYSTDLFEGQTVRQLCRRYVCLLDAVVRDPDQRVVALPLLTPSERHQLLVDWNGAQFDYPRGALIHHLFESQVERTPQAVAVIAGDKALTYAEVDARANRLAHALRSRGVSAGQRIGLCLERGTEMLVALLAIAKSGAAYVPLDPAFPRERLRFMAEDAQLTLVVSTAAQASSCRLSRERQLLLDDDAEIIAGQTDNPLPNELSSGNSDAPAYVIYTSGSTGKPKGVVVPHRAVVNFLTSMAREPGLAGTDVLIAVTTLSFDIAVLELLLPLTVGARVVIASRDEASDGHALSSLINQHQATVMQATPSTWRLLLEAGWTGRTSFKAFVGGEALPKDLAGELMVGGVELWNLYGPTETTIWSTCARLTDISHGITIGKPIANTTIRILDAQKNLCAIGVPGELCIGGDGVTLGYWNRSELTAERFIPDPFNVAAPRNTLYRTGDRARWRNDGTLEHLGRLDDQVKVRGFRIELGEIEATLSEHPDVRQAAAYLWAVKVNDIRIVACCVPTKAGVWAPVSLRKYLRARLPEYMIPHYFLSVSEISLTPNGKVDRRRLPRPIVMESQIGHEEAAADPVEVTIAEIWTALIRPARPISRFDRFFDLGGHSLLALQALQRMADKFGMRLEPRVFFQETLAEIAERCRPTQAAAEAIRKRPAEPVPLALS